MKDDRGVKKFVRNRYASIASRNQSCCSSSCCPPDAVAQAKSMGYSEADIRTLPPPALMGLGCGNPTALAELREGETVLDLGCGGGLDVLLAARRVGEKGLVIGVDMTPEMIAQARENAVQGGYHNVEFRLGEIENLPLENDSVDVIISNCVINLSPDKLKTFKEAFRVLKPGGRMLISDLVTEGELPKEIRQSFEAWACCIAGALERRAYLDVIERAGFRNVTIVAEHRYAEPGQDERLRGKITSVQVRADK